MEDQKKAIFNTVAQRLQIEGFNIVNRDETRPWGGFFVIDEAQAQQFADTYFDGLDVDSLTAREALDWLYHWKKKAKE